MPRESLASTVYRAGRLRPHIQAVPLLDAPSSPGGDPRTRHTTGSGLGSLEGWVEDGSQSALEPAARVLVAEAVDRAGFSARGVHRALRVARTIAGLAGAERVGARALAEALQYRACEARRFATAWPG